MKNILLFSIIIIVLILSFPISNTINSLIPQEKIETWLGVLGLVTTFGGAYIGAKIAGSESRKLFKQEMKMNDLQQHMSANITVLESIKEIGEKLLELKEIIETNTNLTPKTTRQIHDKYAYILKILKNIEKKHLKDTSIIIYNEVVNLYSKTQEKKDLFYQPIKSDDLLNFPCFKEKGYYSVEWQERFVENGELKYYFRKDMTNWGQQERRVSITKVIEDNSSFFNKKSKEMKTEFKTINYIYNEMTYKNPEDLIKVYSQLYKN